MTAASDAAAPGARASTAIGGVEQPASAAAFATTASRSEVPGRRTIAGASTTSRRELAHGCSGAGVGVGVSVGSPSR
jgi:hypothetical protein